MLRKRFGLDTRKVLSIRLLTYMSGLKNLCVKNINTLKFMQNSAGCASCRISSLPFSSLLRLQRVRG